MPLTFYTLTTKLHLTKPKPGTTGWGNAVNANFDKIDQAVPPRGGTAGQVLRKHSSADFDYEWADGGGGGSVDIQAIVFDSFGHIIFSSTGQIVTES